jgi:hypothetical protein
MNAGREPEPGSRALLGHSPLHALRRHWMLVAATTLLATGAASAIAKNREPTYRATVQMVFSPPGPEFGVLGFTPTGGDPAREAATNVIRHSGARHSTIRLVPALDHAVVEILDDGGGVNGSQGNGTGLTGLQERLRHAGGRLEAGPRDDGPGFRVRATVPVASAR